MERLSITKEITNIESRATALYFKDIRKVNVLTAEEEVELMNRIKEGDEEARNQFILSNLRFVISIAKKYQHFGFSFNDVISQGNIGLIEAVKRFDSTKGFKFITYAVWWIRQSIVRSILDNYKTVRVPSSYYWLNNKMKKFYHQFEQENYRYPTPEETSSMMNLDEYDIVTISQTNTEVISLETVIDPENDTQLIDILVNDKTPPPDKELIHQSLAKEIKSALNMLPPKEAKVIELYYGLNGNREHTLFAISRIMNLSEERVSQIKDTALKRLQKITQKQNLVSFLS